jgi:hypothetical protein
MSPVPAAALNIPVTITLPNKQSVVREMPPHDEVDYFLFDQAYKSGLYQVDFGPPLASSELFAVNVDPRESDLSRLEPDELRELLPSWRFNYLTNWQAIASGKTSVTQDRGEMHRYLLHAALFLALLESFLAWRFGHYS